ncbi:MAG: NUDIX domain-containing protein [Chloroflexota bacterium]
MQAGKDYIGVGVGAIVFNTAGEVFLAQRGEKAKNERGAWEFPGGSVEFGEKLGDACIREFAEEYGMAIEVGTLLAVDDHILLDEGQHWVSTTYVARMMGGTPIIKEPTKCSAIGWFALDALPQPLSLISQFNARDYIAKFGYNAPMWDE